MAWYFVRHEKMSEILLFRLEAVVCGLRRTDRMVEYLYEQGSGGDDTVYGSGQRRKPCDLLLFVPVL